MATTNSESKKDKGRRMKKKEATGKKGKVDGSGSRGPQVTGVGLGKTGIRTSRRGERPPKVGYRLGVNVSDVGSEKTPN